MPLPIGICPLLGVVAIPNPPLPTVNGEVKVNEAKVGELVVSIF